MDKINSKESTERGSTGLHQRVVKQVLLKMSSVENCRVWANNTGVGRDLNSERVVRFGLKGSSDIIGIYKGLFLAIEVKTGNARQSKFQKNFQKMIDGYGGIYVVCREVDAQQIDKIVEGIYDNDRIR